MKQNKKYFKRARNMIPNKLPSNLFDHSVFTFKNCHLAYCNTIDINESNQMVAIYI